MTTLYTENGEQIQLKSKIGEGGQGEVWLATQQKKDVAVKLYSKNHSTESQYDAIECLIQKGSPSSAFLWPQSIVKFPEENRFGYIMKLRPNGFHSISDFLARRVTPSFYALLKTGENLATTFQSLHAQGLCYRDISDGNVFFNPKNGDILICDNDNVDVSGSTAGGILGTPRFMAPEVVRREAKPDASTDRYSLAVLLFLLLYGGHPLDGLKESKIRCLDLPALEKLYGHEPVYIWDPKNTSNPPVKGIHDNPIAFKNIYPQALQALFLEAFTNGLHAPNHRIRESQWIQAFQSAQDALLKCACGAENFCAGSVQPTCWKCRQAVPSMPILHIDNKSVILTPGRTLQGRHIGNRGLRQNIAKVVSHPQNANILGLQNLSDTTWTLHRPDGSIVDVHKGRSAPLKNHNKINFVTAQGKIEAPIL